MLKIFIYHNSPQSKDRIEKVVRVYYHKLGGSPDIKAYSKKEDAIKWLQRYGSYADILFFDCSEQEVAINMARTMRDNNLRASWVYVGGDVEGLYDSLLWRPSAKIDNISDMKQIVCTIKKLDDYHRALKRKYDFIFKYEGEYIHIPYQNITYFDSDKKKVTLHLRDKSRTYCFTAKLEDIQKKLPNNFLRCHQSYLVNLEEVRRVDLEEKVFILNNDDDVLISRRQFKAVKERYKQFVEVRNLDPLSDVDIFPADFGQSVEKIIE